MRKYFGKVWNDWKVKWFVGNLFLEIIYNNWQLRDDLCVKSSEKWFVEKYLFGKCFLVKWLLQRCGKCLYGHSLCVKAWEMFCFWNTSWEMICGEIPSCNEMRITSLKFFEAKAFAKILSEYILGNDFFWENLKN